LKDWTSLKEFRKSCTIGFLNGMAKERTEALSGVLGAVRLLFRKRNTWAATLLP